MVRGILRLNGHWVQGSTPAAPRVAVRILDPRRARSIELAQYRTKTEYRMLTKISPAAAAIVMIAIITALLMLHRLGDADVCTGNEAVEGVFVQQMVEHNHLLFPLENGKVPMYKPPLFHWTAVAIDRIAGIRKVTSANLRLPSAMYAVAGVLLTILFAYRFLGP